MQYVVIYIYVKKNNTHIRKTYTELRRFQRRLYRIYSFFILHFWLPTGPHDCKLVSFFPKTFLFRKLTILQRKRHIKPTNHSN